MSWCFWSTLLLAAPHGVWPAIEFKFDLPAVEGSPFDYRANDVQVGLQGPDGSTVTLPAFFDGGQTWRVRHAPTAAGTWQVVRVSRNGQPLATPVMPAARQVSGAAGPGYVRLDAAKQRFIHDDGTPYWPLGCNVGWAGREGPTVAQYLQKMGALGLNWSRVWMCAWDGKTLDWRYGRKLVPGELDLDAARLWDGILQSAEAAGVRLQMVLQHHGQYSTKVNPNWQDHPWNQRNGGWLPDAAAFFTDVQARELTKAKYRYLIARYGYSTSLLAWELFNEVQYVDAVAAQPAAVVAWHREMADFIRAQDPWRHLLVTSSDLKLRGIWEVSDYYQPHTYPPDLVSAVQALDELGLDKPYFFGECGPGGDLMADDGSGVRDAVWASLCTNGAGAAQYWTWDRVERANLWPFFAAAAKFVAAARLPSRTWRASRPIVETIATGPLEFGPGGDGWRPPTRADFLVRRDGSVDGLGQISPFLHGTYHRDLAQELRFAVDYPTAGTFEIDLGRVARAGARVSLQVGTGAPVTVELPAAERDYDAQRSLTVAVPAGPQTVTVRGGGTDWVVLQRFRLSSYAPALTALSRSGPDGAVAWIRRRGQGEPVSGRLLLPGLAAGTYEARWYATATGNPLGPPSAVTVAAGQPLPLPTPPVATDLALLVQRRD